MSEAASPKPEPHPGIAGLAIAVMGLALAWVLERAGLLDSLDAFLAGWVDGMGVTGIDQQISGRIEWLWTIVATIALCQVLLHVRRTWRRMVVSVVLAFLTICWVPVLALAGYQTPLFGPLLALLWGSIGSMLYAARHREPRIM